MDLVGACRAFVAVGRRGSFTDGAAAARIPQSVASRRVAALEDHLGARLLDRSSRHVALTAVGRDVLPSARRLVELADALEHDAERARRRPVRLAVPAASAPRRLARLAADARGHGVHLDLHQARPGERVAALRALEVRAALVAVPALGAPWRVPLGLAGRHGSVRGAAHLEALRPGRGGAGRPRRVWVEPEDDVPHVRDPLTRAGDAVGLAPGQVALAPSLVAAASEVLAADDLLLCGAEQAADLGLGWRPVAEVVLQRGYDVLAGAPDDAEHLRGELGAALARCLGAPAGPGRP